MQIQNIAHSIQHFVTITLNSSTLHTPLMHSVSTCAIFISGFVSRFTTKEKNIVIDLHISHIFKINKFSWTTLKDGKQRVGND